MRITLSINAYNGYAIRKNMYKVGVVDNFLLLRKLRLINFRNIFINSIMQVRHTALTMV